MLSGKISHAGNQAEVDRINTALLEAEKKLNLSHTYCPNQFYLPNINISARLSQIAFAATENQGDSFAMDAIIPFSQLGEAGVKAYLGALQHQFIKLVERNKISKGYTLVLPPENPVAILNGMQRFLAQYFEINAKYVFCCHQVNLTINPDNLDETGISIEALCKLIPLLDKAKLNYLNLQITALPSQYVEQLAQMLKGVNHTRIRFQGLQAGEALQLESINETQLQASVPYHYQSNTAAGIPKHDISKQPSPVTVAQIQALLTQKIDLQPVLGKAGIQNQYHYEHAAQQKTEVSILQSWQVEQAKEVKAENKQGFSYLHGEEQNTLINWHDIKAALDPNNPQHDSARARVGEEICHYCYKGRNLIDLWRRLTGDITLTKQDSVPDPSNSSAMSLQFFSPLIPKQISYKTLLTIVRHPQLFQSGLNIESLPATFCFSSHYGALYIDPAMDKNADPFTPQLDTMTAAQKPSTEHFQQLSKSDIPSKQFFDYLNNFMSNYQAWHAWRLGFSALNIFNQSGVRELIALLDKCLKSTDQAAEPVLHYFMQALNYYYYQSMANQQDALANSQNPFEDQEQKNQQLGIENSLSSTAIQALPKAMREDCHQGLVLLLTQNAFRANKNSEDKTSLAYQQVILTTLAYHQNKLLADNIPMPFMENVPALLDKLEYHSGIKLMELVLCHHTSVIHNVFSLLNDIHQVWGDVGLADFNRCFIAPVISLAPLAQTKQVSMVSKLLLLSAVQYHWWQQLTLQHVTQSGFADFGILMAAFQHFLDELAALGLQDALSMPCPLQGISNLQVDLWRVVTLLKRCKKPAEQMRNLQDLDWSALGVVYAAQTINYQYVTASMQLNLAFESAAEEFMSQGKYSDSYRKFHHYDASPFLSPESNNHKSNQQLFEFMLGVFFRYIGCRKYTAPMPVYQQLLEALVLPDKYIFIKESHCIAYFNGILDKTIDLVAHDNEFVLSR